MAKPEPLKPPSRARRTRRVPRLRHGAHAGATPAPAASRARIRVMAYGPQGLEEQEVTRVEEVQQMLGRWPVTWVNVESVRDLQVVQQLGTLFGLHPLALEDVVHTHQRPKVELYSSQYYIVTRMPAAGGESEQLSLFLGRDFVLTFQEDKLGDCLDPLRARIREPGRRVRAMGADYLAYAILDAVVDRYFPLLEQLGEELETLEQEVLAEPGRQTISRVLELKHDLLVLRRAVWPLREALSELLRDTAELFSAETKIFLRDAYDHVVQMIDLVETYREIGVGLMDSYMLSIGNRTNEAIRVLTIIATIFIPLSFIASVYGMNFNTASSVWNMPELNWVFGYPLALGMMAIVAIALLVYFHRKGWLRSAFRPRP
jgi:magnesium transporter